MSALIKTVARSTTPGQRPHAAQPRFPKKGILLEDHDMRADSGSLRIVSMVGGGYKSTSNVGRQVNKAVVGVVEALEKLGAEPSNPKLFKAENYNANEILSAIHARLCAIEDKEDIVVGSWTLVINYGEPRRIVGAIIESGKRRLVVGPTFKSYEEI